MATSTCQTELVATARRRCSPSSPSRPSPPRRAATGRESDLLDVVDIDALRVQNGENAAPCPSVLPVIVTGGKSGRHAMLT